MPTNTYANTKKVAVGIKLLKNKLNVTKDINQKYSKTFKGPESLGDSIDIRVPFNPSVRTGAAYSAQDFGEQKRTLKIDTQKGVDVGFTLKERALDIKEYADRVMRPEMANLATGVESDILSKIVPVTSNVLAVADADFGSDVGYLAKAILLENMCPDDRLKMYINPRDQAKIVKGSESLFNPVADIAGQIKKGEMEDNYGLRWSASTLIPRYITGTASRVPGAITVSVDATNPSSDATSMNLTITGLGATATVKAGEVFTIAGIYGVNYATKESTQQLKQFVVLEDAVAVADVVTLSIRPVFSSAMNQYQTITALPVVGDVLTLIGAASSSYSQSFCMSPDAYTAAFAQVKVQSSKEDQATYSEDGVSMRYWESDDFDNDANKSRFDVYYGVIDLWEQWALRVINLG